MISFFRLLYSKEAESISVGFPFYISVPPSTPCTDSVVSQPDDLNPESTPVPCHTTPRAYMRFTRSCNASRLCPLQQHWSSPRTEAPSRAEVPGWILLFTHWILVRFNTSNESYQWCGGISSASDTILPKAPYWNPPPSPVIFTPGSWSSFETQGKKTACIAGFLVEGDIGCWNCVR